MNIPRNSSRSPMSTRMTYGLSVRVIMALASWCGMRCMVRMRPNSVDTPSTMMMLPAETLVSLIASQSWMIFSSRVMHVPTNRA